LNLLDFDSVAACLFRVPRNQIQAVLSRRFRYEPEDFSRRRRVVKSPQLRAIREKTSQGDGDSALLKSAADKLTRSKREAIYAVARFAPDLRLF